MLVLCCIVCLMLVLGCITVDLLIFACFNFRDILILGLFTKFRIPKLLIFLISAIIIIIFATFLNSVLHAKFTKIKTSRILPDLQYMFDVKDVIDISGMLYYMFDVSVVFYYMVLCEQCVVLYVRS